MNLGVQPHASRDKSDVPVVVTVYAVVQSRCPLLLWACENTTAESLAPRGFLCRTKDEERFETAEQPTWLARKIPDQNVKKSNKTVTVRSTESKINCSLHFHNLSYKLQPNN